MTEGRVVEIKNLLDHLLDDDGAWVGAPSPDERATAAEAVDNFKSAGPNLLDEATPFLWAYYRSVRDSFDDRERSEYGIPDLDEHADIWSHIEVAGTVEFSLGRDDYSPGRSYLSFEGNVTWEPEHGLQLVFEDGAKLCKVGPYDGHMTNAHAYADVSLLGVVFKD